MAHVAARADLPMAANCIAVRSGPPFAVTRLRWGGSLLEDAELDGTPKLLTVAPHAVRAEPAAAATPERGGWPEVVVVPELQPAKRAPAAGQESAADMLDRLVEPVGAHDPSDDAGDLRARLARTAAIKKPGSKERREADEQHYRD